jgi:multidrug efflux pump subunit AcrB
MKKVIEWFTHNDVAANLLMVTILGAGFYALNARIPLEVFPAFELSAVNVRVPFPGASPVEVEEGVTIKIEEAIHDLAGIKQIRSTAQEGLGTVQVEVEPDADPKALMNDIKARVDAINTFPVDSERPTVYVPEIRRDVITVVVSGDLPERELRVVAEQVRDDLAALDGVTQLELDGVRPYEISIEVSEQALRQYGLTLAQVAEAVGKASLDLAAGSVRTAGGEIRLRTEGQARIGREFEDIVVRADGNAKLTVADIGVVRDGFEEETVDFRFNGRPAAFIDVYRIGDQSAIDVADAVKDYMADARSRLPPGVSLDYWRDTSEVVKARISTLTRSAIQGSLLVLILLTLFLRPSVAFWVLAGMPVAFMGGIALMPVFGVTINLLSLFAFILVLGIVVDDAIVTGENIYRHLQQREDPTRAAIVGTQEIAVPVTFGVLTTVAAFIPLLMVEGVRGQLFAQIPMVVIPVLLFSLIESKLILPAHLKHVRVQGLADSEHSWLTGLQRRIARGLDEGTRRIYAPVLRAAMANRYLTLSLFLAAAILLFSLAVGGHLRFIFFPRVPSEVVRATVYMPQGTPFEATREAVQRMTEAAQDLQADFVENLFSTVGSAGGGQRNQSHIGRVAFEVVAPEDRTVPVTSPELVREWRERIGVLPGAREINFRAERVRGGNPIDIQLQGPEFAEMRIVADEIKAHLNTYPGVFDVFHTFEGGKEEVKLTLRPEAELLGLTLDDLARQVRQAFYGFEVQRIQRGRDEVRVFVRFPEAERRSLETLSGMRIRTPDGTEVPFGDVASASFGRGFSTIQRVDRFRAVNVRADVNKETADLEAIKRDLETVLPEILLDHPRVSYVMEGEAREQDESFASVGVGIVFVLFVIYVLLAIPFRSYVQPLIVMSVIPFGVAGAMLGHMIMGMNLSIMSIMGMLALCGVVVNDSLVLVDYVNRQRRAGTDLMDAVGVAGLARLRPVILTSLTTFAGLTPLLMEKSTQAQWLIPMAVSLGFGILFATVITLLLIPVNYLILEDFKALGRRIADLYRRPAPTAE